MNRKTLWIPVFIASAGTLAWFPTLPPTHDFEVHWAFASEDEPVLIAQEDGSGEQVATDVDTIVANVQGYYDNLEDFHADFSQEFTNLTLGDTRTSEGHVYFRTPGMMRWDYLSPTERYLIRDGEDLWVYEPEFAQYYTQPMDESDLPTALRFLMGQGELTEDFEVTIHEEGDETVTLNLVPRDAATEYTQLRLVVRRSTWEVAETILYDALGNTNRLIFSNTALNSGLPESGFIFEPPEGTHQIEGP